LGKDLAERVLVTRPRGKIRLVRRQTPNDMEVAGKHHDCRDLERMRLPCLLKCVPQSIGMLDEQLSVPFEMTV
jgi:hypothetical protein